MDPVSRGRPAPSKPLRVRALPLVMLALLAACEPLGPAAPLPDRAVALTAPPEYRAWWAQTEACSESQGRLERIQWFVVPGVSGFMTAAGERVGSWSWDGGVTRIVIAGDYVGHELVVRHEMLHALLYRGDHPPQYFSERCQLTWDSWGG